MFSDARGGCQCESEIALPSSINPVAAKAGADPCSADAPVFRTRSERIHVAARSAQALGVAFRS
jgi:hypothetical protein